MCFCTRWISINKIISISVLHSKIVFWLKSFSLICVRLVISLPPVFQHPSFTFHPSSCSVHVFWDRFHHCNYHNSCMNEEKGFLRVGHNPLVSSGANLHCWAAKLIFLYCMIISFLSLSYLWHWKWSVLALSFLLACFACVLRLLSSLNYFASCLVACCYKLQASGKTWGRWGVCFCCCPVLQYGCWHFWTKEMHQGRVLEIVTATILHWLFAVIVQQHWIMFRILLIRQFVSSIFHTTIFDKSSHPLNSTRIFLRSISPLMDYSRSVNGIS